MPIRPAHLLQIMLLGTIWGSTFPLVKLAVEGVNPVTFVTGRVLLGALVLTAIVRARRLRMPDRRGWFHVAVMAVVGNIFTNFLIAWGQQHVPSNLGAILNGATPFFTLLFAAGLFQTERFSGLRLGGLILGFVGVGTLTGGGLADLSSRSVQGQIALLGASCFYGLSFAYARRFVRGEPLALAAAQMIAATAFMLPLTALFGEVGSTSLTPTRLISWVIVGALASGLSYVYYYRLIAEVGATVTSYATYIIPVAGTLLGWVLLDERIGLRLLLGVALILTGLLIATRPARPLRDAPTAEAVASPEPSSAPANQTRTALPPE